MKNLKRILESQRDELRLLDLSALCTRKEEQEVQLNSNLAQLELKVMEGLKLTHRRLVEQHRRDNQPLVFSENGVVQFVDPNTVEV